MKKIITHFSQIIYLHYKIIIYLVDDITGVAPG